MSYFIHSLLVLQSLFATITSTFHCEPSDGHASIQPPCPGDINGDDRVNGIDIVLFTGMYPCPQGSCAADLNSDGAVDGEDIAFLLANMGSDCN